MKLLDLCEPLFQYICLLKRSVHRGAEVLHESVKAEINSILRDIRSRAALDPELHDQYERIEIVLLFFIDSMIAESSLPFSDAWEPLAFERGVLTGDERFFAMLDDTLDDPSDGATSRLAIFYVCLGLGFKGIYFNDPEEIRLRMMKAWARIKGKVGVDPSSRICPTAYDNVDGRDFGPIKDKLVFLGIGAAAVLVAVFVAYGVFFYRATDQLRDAVDQVNGRVHAESAVQATDESRG